MTEKGGTIRTASTDSYYKHGSKEVATETPLTIQKLEKRRYLTPNANRLVIVLVGLPGRGKSFISRKIQNFMTWRGDECKIFNVGRYRRQVYAEMLQESENNKNKVSFDDPHVIQRAESREARENIGACSSNFFDAKNKQASELRQRAAAAAMKDMLLWLDDDDLVENPSEVKTGTTITTSTATSKHHQEVVEVEEREITDSSEDDEDSPTISIPKKDRIAIYDATNSTKERRAWILKECNAAAACNIKRNGGRIGVIFVESIMDDKELLEENFRFKVLNSPDFKGMEREDAIADLKNRVQKYEETYETITDDSLSYIKIFNLSSKILVNHIYGRVAKVIVPALMAWNIGTRPIFLCRAGTTHNHSFLSLNGGSRSQSLVSLDGGDKNGENEKYRDNGNKNVISPEMAKEISRSPQPPHYYRHRRVTSGCWERSPSTIPGSAGSVKRSLLKADKLGPSGNMFREALCRFVVEEGTEFMVRRQSAFSPSLDTGTSISGTASKNVGDIGRDGKELPCPIVVLSSTMPRAVQTGTWDNAPYPVEQRSSLNPLDKGDFAGMELEDIRVEHPDWYGKLEKNPFYTRFPGGECYHDLINRLESFIIDIEQQVAPVVVVGHVSVLQVLIAYFRNSPVEQCTSIEVPIHTVIKFTPAQGGGWSESYHPLLVNDSCLIPPIFHSSPNLLSEDTNTAAITGNEPLLSAADDRENQLPPIWGDHVPKKYH